MVKSFKFYIYLSSLLLLLLPLFTNSVHADTHWTPSGNNIYNTNSGNVGVGNTNPGLKFEVTGNIITRQSTGTGVASLISADGYGSSLWTNNSYDPANPGTGWTRHITFKDNKVGFATTSPIATLHIADVAGRNLQLGDDAYFYDDDLDEGLILAGNDSGGTQGMLKLGSGGAALRGESNKLIVAETWSGSTGNTSGKIQMGVS